MNNNNTFLNNNIPWYDIQGRITFWILKKIVELRETIRKKLKGKRVLLFGPRESGKSTLVNWLKFGKPVDEYEPTNANNESYYSYHDEEHDIIYDFLDRGGADGSLVYKGDSLYKSHDIILVFFNVAKYLRDNSYKANVNARFEALASWYKEKKKPILFIGSYKDKLCRWRQKKASTMERIVDPSKDYFQFVSGQKLVLADMFKKSDVEVIMKALNELIK